MKITYDLAKFPDDYKINYATDYIANLLETDFIYKSNKNFVENNKNKYNFNYVSNFEDDENIIDNFYIIDEKLMKNFEKYSVTYYIIDTIKSIKLIVKFNSSTEYAIYKLKE